jgi:hypothetical protein
LTQGNGRNPAAAVIILAVRIKLPSQSGEVVAAPTIEGVAGRKVEVMVVGIKDAGY